MVKLLRPAVSFRLVVPPKVLEAATEVSAAVTADKVIARELSVTTVLPNWSCTATVAENTEPA